MPITILLIDDNAADAGVVKRLLSNVDGEPYVVLHELDADAGMDAIKNGGIDCAILAGDCVHGRWFRDRGR